MQLKRKSSDYLFALFIRLLKLHFTVACEMSEDCKQSLFQGYFINLVYYIDIFFNVMPYCLKLMFILCQIKYSFNFQFRQKQLDFSPHW